MRTTGEHEQVATVRLVTRAFMRDPYPALRWLRDEAPSAATPTAINGVRMWVITRYEDVRRVLGDRSFIKDPLKIASNSVTKIDPDARKTVLRNRSGALPYRIRRGVLDQDGADHRRLRSLLRADFQRDRIAELRPRIEEVTQQLLDEMSPDEPIDLVAQFARPLAATVVSELLGIAAEDRHGFPQWENTIFTGTSAEEIRDAGVRLETFCRQMIALKRAQPGEDLFTALVRAERDGKLDEDELASTFANLLIGGMEPATAIASGVAILLDHREQLSRLIDDPGLWRGCVEEILRYESTFRIMAPRCSAKELRLEGVTIPAGDLVASCPAAANRDPTRFANPDAFDMTRYPNVNLSFGHGPHHCIGIHLARLEIAVALQGLFTRFPHSRLQLPWRELSWSPGAFMRRLATLPVILR